MQRVSVTTFWATVGLYGCLALLLSAQRSAAAAPAAERAPAVLFSESFDNARLLQRGWYDGDRFSIPSAQPCAGKGCIEYGWKAGATTPATSSGIRHLFEPTDSVYLRCYIRLSRGWGKPDVAAQIDAIGRFEEMANPRGRGGGRGAGLPPVFDAAFPRAGLG